MSAVKDRLVNVPIRPGDIINTIQNIPRTPKEAGLIQVKLKRRLKYKNFHKQEYIDPQKIFQMLEYLRTAGHPYYQFYDDYNVFKRRCREESLKIPKNDFKTLEITVKYSDDREIQPIIDLDKKKIVKTDNCQDDDENDENEEVMNEEEHYIANDPIRKFQFDHNGSTCLTNKFPEMLGDA